MDRTPRLPVPTARVHPRKLRLRDSAEGYLFIAPASFLIAVFGLFPIGYTIFVSLHKWRIIQGRFLGLENFTSLFGSGLWLVVFAAGLLALTFGVRFLTNRRRTRRPGAAFENFRIPAALLLICGGICALIFSLPGLWNAGDSNVFDALRVTLYYSAGTVPIQLAGGLFLAVFLERKFKGRQAYRVIYLLPYIVPTVASAAAFQVLFSLRPESLANQIVKMLGGSALGWLGERKGILAMAFHWGTNAGTASPVTAYWSGWAAGPSLALVAIMIYNYWVFTGYYALIYSNGLASIPRQLYEAAEVDGASRWTMFRHITVPLLSPTTYFLTMLGIIGTFKSFNSIYVLRSNAIGNAVDTLSINIFYTFFSNSRFGYAAAVSLFLFALVIGLTYVQRRLMEEKVHYGD